MEINLHFQQERKRVTSLHASPHNFRMCVIILAQRKRIENTMQRRANERMLARKYNTKPLAHSGVCLAQTAHREGKCPPRRIRVVYTATSTTRRCEFGPIEWNASHERTRTQTPRAPWRSNQFRTCLYAGEGRGMLATCMRIFVYVMLHVPLALARKCCGCSRGVCSGCAREH